MSPIALYLLQYPIRKIRIDGPALTVSQPNAAMKRYPFSRISRVISLADHIWSHNALITCLQKKVTVYFIDRDGKPVGSFNPTRPKRQHDNDAIADLLWHPDALNRINNWRRSQIMHQIHHAQTIDPEKTQFLKRTWVYQRTGYYQPGNRAEQRQLAVMLATANDYLTQRQIQPYPVQPQDSHLDLNRELAELLLLDWQLNTASLAAETKDNLPLTLLWLHQRERQHQQLLGKAINALIRRAHEG